MRNLLLLLALALPVSAFAADTDSFSAAPAKPSVQERLAKARQAIAAQDWNAAMRELEVAVREAPRNADVHNLMGYTYRKRAHPDLPKAYEHYDTALKLDPNHRGAREYLGEAYLQDKRLGDAEVQLVALERICGGKTCEEYEDLAKSIADYKAKN
jgi:Tfp pilus assembly protein PilF